MQPVTVEQAYEQLVAALQDMAQQEAKARAATDVLHDMLQSRRRIAELAAEDDIRYDQQMKIQGQTFEHAVGLCPPA